MGTFRLRRREFLGLLPAAAVAAPTIAVPGRADGAPPRQGALDIVIRGGTVIDGSNRERFTADVGIVGGYIAAIGDLSGQAAATEIDASGLVVVPGFIDVHAHSSDSALPVAENSLKQGVTTEITQPDGGGILRIGQHLSREPGELGINIGAYIGFNTVWRTVVGNEDRRATGDEILHMRRRVESGLENGAWGVSAGLFYSPATFAETDQVIEVAEAARPWRTHFTNHIRNENVEVIEATEENITIGEQAGLVPETTHMKVQGPDNWGKSEETIGLIQDAVARGTYAAADVYPYLAGQTGLTAIVPRWVLDGGRDAYLERFADPELRPQIEQEIEDVMHSRVEGPGDIWIHALAQTLADAAASRWDDSPVSAGEATMRILEEDGNVSCIYHQGHEEDFRRILLNPTTAVASDGGATTSTATHPRRYGTFPRVLGHYVRDEGVLDLETAVYKMTYLPATIIGMVDRGLLAPGTAADVTVFDPETIIDRATFEEPAQLAEGVQHVIINGQLALSDGELIDAHAGAPLRRSSGMISRPATGDEPVQAQVAGRLVPPKRPAPKGETFTADFSSDEVGQPPAGWTGDWRDGDWEVLDGPRRLHMGSTSGRRALTWDAVGIVDGDVEVFGRVRGGGNDNLFYLGVLVSGDAGNENAYFLRARTEDSDTPNELHIFRYLNGGSYTQVHAVMPFSVQEDTWYKVLLQREGDRMRGKMWPDDSDEPLDWQVEVSVYETEDYGDLGEAMGPGAVGPTHCCSGAVNDWAFLAVGTGGERAPRPPDDPPPVTDNWRQAEVAFNAAGADGSTTGQLVLTVPDHDVKFRGSQFGKLQVTGGWASVTGRGRFVGEDEERAFHLILDEENPLEGTETTVTIQIEDEYRLTGVLDGGR